MGVKEKWRTAGQGTRSVNRPNKGKVKDRDQNKLAVRKGRIMRKMHSPESWEMDKSMYPPDNAGRGDTNARFKYPNKDIRK